MLSFPTVDILVVPSSVGISSGVQNRMRSEGSTLAKLPRYQVAESSVVSCRSADKLALSFNGEPQA